MTSPLRTPHGLTGNLSGPQNPTRRNFADCLVIAEERLAAREATTNRSITYKELHAKATELAVKLKTVFNPKNSNASNQPICLHMHRGIDWYIAYMACAKAEIPVVGASKDLPDKAVENRRLEDIFSILSPIGVIVDHSDDVRLFDKYLGVPVYVIADLLQDNPLQIDKENDRRALVNNGVAMDPEQKGNEPNHVSIIFNEEEEHVIQDHEGNVADIYQKKEKGGVLAYHFTGGTTAASKCVVVTHEMAIHEIDSYPTILPSFVRRPETVLQNSSMYWPASAFGQLDIAIAFQACAVLSVVGGASSDEVSTIIEKERVDCIGVVPSVLRSLNPDTCSSSLSLVFTWGEALPRSVASEWCNRVDLVDLLIATEYWLSFYSVITLPSQVGTYQIVPNTRIHLEHNEEDERAAVLWVAGPMVTPGYVGNAARDRFRIINGDEYFCTNDCVKLEKDGLTYLGRSDGLQKVGGKFVDLVAASNEIIEHVERHLAGDVVKDCILVRDQWNQVHAIFTLNQPAPVHTLVTASQKKIGSILPKHVHILAEMPRNVATGKVDFKALSRMMSDESLASPQYSIPDSEVPAGKLLSLPNPHRYMWLVLVVSVLSINWELILRGLVQVAVSSVDQVPILSLLRLPFLTHGLHALKRLVPGLKSLLHEFPGDIQFVAIFLLAVWGKDECLFSPIVRLVTLIGDVCIVRPEMPIQDVVRTTVCLASAALGIAVIGFARELTSLSVVTLVPLIGLSTSPLTGLGLLAFAEMAVGDVAAWGHVATGVWLAGFASFEGMKSLASFLLIFYVTAPFDLAWAWTSWWKDVPSYLSVFLYYGKHIAKMIAAVSGQRVTFTWVRITNKFLTTCWDSHTESGYKRRKVHHESPSAEYRRQYSCDNCGKWVIESEGAYDKYSKFSSAGSNWWVCENCWWSDIVDSKKGYKYPRIGMWTNNWISGKLRRAMFPSAPVTPSLEETISDDDDKSTRHPSISGIEDPIESLVVPSQHSVTAKVCLEALQSVGVDKQILPGISSLQRVAVHEQLKKRIPAVSLVSAMKLFKDVDTFSDLVNTIVQLSDANQPPRTVETGDGAGLYKIAFAGSHLWEHGACDWLLRFKCEEVEDGLTNPEETFTNAFQQLVRIHPALRARPLDDMSLGNSLLQAISLSPRWLKALVLPACLQLWPRVAVAPFNPEDSIPISFEYMENGFSQKSVLARASRYRNDSRFEPPFDVVVYLPGDGRPITTAYIYVRVTHLFADGFCVNAISSDLDGLLKKELVAASETVNAFKCLEYRLTRSLRSGGSFPIESSEEQINLCSQAEEVYRDKSLVQVLWLQHTTVKSLVELSAHLGIPMETVMIGLVMGSLATKLGWAKLPVHLMHAQRDGVDEPRMIGYFSDYKDLGFLNTSSSYMDLFHQLSTKLRNREWRLHSNETLYDHSVGRHAWDESVFPVSFNVLPRFRKSKDGLIDNIETYWRAGPRFGQKDCRLIHVYMEETRLGKEWAVRLHVNKRLFDCAWIVDYVCRVFDNAIKTVLSDPSKPIPVS